MTKTLIKPHQLKEMPWKNGLGITSEIEIFPSGSDLTQGDFHWRLSSAQITATNSFSNFQGYDRCLTVLTGEGLSLNGHTLKPFDVYKFHGEEKIECSLLGSAVKDLGIIYDRKLYQCEMIILEITQKTDLNLRQGIHFLKPLSSVVFFDKRKLQDEILKIEGPDDCEIDASTFPVKILKISIIKI